MTTILAERYKPTRSHLVPLTEWMMEQFGDGEFCFSVDGKKPYGNLVKPKRVLDKVSGVSGWTIRDLRRTVRTGLSRL